MMELVKSPYLGRQPAKEGATWLEAIARPEFQNSADNDLYFKVIHSSFPPFNHGSFSS